jgi:hypothetical protein
MDVVEQTIEVARSGQHVLRSLSVIGAGPSSIRGKQPIEI